MKFTATDLIAMQARVAQNRAKGKPQLEAAPAVAVKTDVTTRLEVSLTKDEQGLNQVERKFWAWLQRQGHAWVGCQNQTLKIADDTRLTPDFSALVDGKIIFYDTKHKRVKNGVRRLHVEEDAAIKFKVAARQFPMYEFYYVTEGVDGWEFKKVEP